jgi:hypothetical protein
MYGMNAISALIALNQKGWCPLIASSGKNKTTHKYTKERARRGEAEAAGVLNQEKGPFKKKAQR